MNASMNTPAGYAYAVCLKTDDKPIGYIKIETDDSYDFGYGLKKEFWGRGIMTEAGSILLKQAKADGYSLRHRHP